MNAGDVPQCPMCQLPMVLKAADTLPLNMGATLTTAHWKCERCKYSKKTSVRRDALTGMGVHDGA